MISSANPDTYEIATPVLVVDDHAGFRGALEELLAQADGITVVGSASNGAQAIEMVASLQPSVVIMDLAMPVLSGVEATRHICSQDAAPVVVALSGCRTQWREARAAGAAYTMLKGEDPERLIATIRAAAGL